jgi:hypothetical protein
MANDHLQQQAKRPLLGLLWGVLFRPRKTFAYLKDNRRKAWWLPAILILALTIAPLLVGSAVAGRQTFDPAMMGPEGSSRVYGPGPVVVVEGGIGAEEPPSSSSPSQSAGPGLFRIAGAIPGAILGWLIWGVALYSASVFLGRSSGFRQMARLAVWAWMPYAVRGLVQTIYILVSGNQIVNAGLSGFVIDKNSPSLMPVGPGTMVLASALGRIDLYLFWNLALFTLGLMAFTNLPRKKALVAVLVIWSVLTLLGVIPAMLGGIFG